MRARELSKLYKHDYLDDTNLFYVLNGQKILNFTNIPNILNLPN